MSPRKYFITCKWQKSKKEVHSKFSDLWFSSVRNGSWDLRQVCGRSQDHVTQAWHQMTSHNLGLNFTKLYIQPYPSTDNKLMVSWHELDNFFQRFFTLDWKNCKRWVWTFWWKCKKRYSIVRLRLKRKDFNKKSKFQNSFLLVHHFIVKLDFSLKAFLYNFSVFSPYS